MRNKECCGVVPSGNQLMFSTVLEGASGAALENSLFLVLYSAGKDCPVIETRIPVPADRCLGNLLRILIDPSDYAFDPGKDCYGYLIRGRRVPDPYAEGYLSLTGCDGEAITGCIADPGVSSGNKDTDVRPLPIKRDWNSRFIYQCHVRGLTKSSPFLRDEHIKGTFDGVIHMIPHILSLGATTVELMPVAAPRIKAVRPSESSAVRESSADPAAAGTAAGIDYWGFHPAAFHAVNPLYAPGGDVRDAAPSLRRLVKALHKAGLELVLQVYVNGDESAQEVQSMLRYYALDFGVDGFHMIGMPVPFSYLFTDPVLADRLFIGEGLGSVPAGRSAAEYGDGYSNLVRQLVKGDDLVLKSFLSSFAGRREGTGDIRYIADYRGFTLLDLVSYSRKHNEANGEENRDGEDRNYSWNCGAEGETSSRTINLLRLQQIRNFLVLTLLGGGTPLLFSGDEALNTQSGNNNPYNQDNETGHIVMRSTKAARSLTAFIRELIRFRSEHPVLTRATPYRFGDSLGLGYPDLSFHGSEAWKPDLTAYSHTAGILFNEGYAMANPVPGEGPLLYIAVNCYWEEASFGLPRLAPGFVWREVLSTAGAGGFLSPEREIGRGDSFAIPPRSVSVLASRRKEV